jgi:hypothetical protein
MRVCLAVPATCLLLLSACGDGSTGRESGSSVDGIGNETDGGNSLEGNSQGDGDGDASSSNTDTNTTDPTDGTEAGHKFDTLAIPDAGQAACGGGNNDDPEWSYIWVANSGEGTISKVNTTTLIEEGRYRTRSDNAGSPSRTSVNLTGDVAVANRSSGVTKVVALHENCDEMTNGQPGLQTSSGKNDVLAWGGDDCVAWYTAFDGFNNQRPVAWTSGVLNQATCTVEDQFVWTTASVHSQGGSLHVYRLNGDDGSIDEDIQIPEIGSGYFMAYGGAVDSENDFWFVTYDTQQLVQVDYEDLTYDIHPTGTQCPYGFTVDSLDRPWVGDFCSGSGFFDPLTEQWTTLPGILGYGLQEDDEQVMWLATFSPPGLRGIDINTQQETNWIMLPTGSSRGVSVDFEGYVWFVDMSTSAWKVDTDAGTWESYNGLNGPYTYSDMTGHGLNLVSGGIPAN